MDKDIQPVPIIYNQSSISFPLDENAFKDFMTSLLGQPESIEGKVKGAFEINMGDFEYLNNLIDTRIAKQNLSSLLEFRAKLFFNDDSSISFNGTQNLLQYKELRPIICEGFVFTWSYLVKFNNKQASEKQEISIFSIKEDNSIDKKSKRISLLSYFDIKTSDKAPEINYSVRCTDKDWGIEITELIRRCVLKFIKVGSSPTIILRQKIVENFKLVELSSLLLNISVTFSILFQPLEMGAKACNSLANQVERYIDSGFSLDNKIDFLIQLVITCYPKNVSSFTSLFLLSIIPLFFGTFVVPLLIYKLIQLPNYRFLLFTDESKKQRDVHFRKLADRKTFWIVTILIGLIMAIVGNYAFRFLTKIFG